MPAGLIVSLALHAALLLAFMIGLPWRQSEIDLESTIAVAVVSLEDVPALAGPDPAEPPPTPVAPPVPAARPPLTEPSAPEPAAAPTPEPEPEPPPAPEPIQAARPEPVPPKPVVTEPEVAEDVEWRPPARQAAPVVEPEAEADAPAAEPEAPQQLAALPPEPTPVVEPEPPAVVPPAPLPSRKPEPPPEPIEVAAAEPEPEPEPALEAQAEPEPPPEPPQADPLADVLSRVLDNTAANSTPPPPQSSVTQFAAAGQAQRLSASVEDAVREAIRPCWNVDPGALNASDIVIEIRATLRPDATVAAAEVVSSTGPVDEARLRAEAGKAWRAVMNEQCQPWPLPAEAYDQWRTTILVFNPREWF